MKKLLYTLLAISLIFSSCKKEDDNNSSNPFSGDWEGTYYGGETGEWVGTVKSNGDIDGIITSDSGDFYLATGTVTNSGTFELVIGSLTSGAVFSGNATGNTVEGDWVNSLEGISGEWSGSKQ